MRSQRWFGPWSRAAGLLLLILSLARDGDGVAKPGAHPSVILVVLDACRADHLSAYGYHRQTTPNLDRLASNGLVFLRHYSQSDGTITSVSQFMLSAFQPPLVISSPGEPYRPDSNAKGSLPAILGEDGYLTALFAGHPYFNPKLSPLTRIFTTFVNVADIVPPQQKANLRDILQEFLPWLRRQDRRPVFAYLHAMDTHFPHPLRTDHPVFVDGAYRPAFGGGQPPAWANQISDADRKHVVDLYDEDLHEADEQIGLLISTLRELGRLDDTVVIVTADHGEQLYEHGNAGHGYGDLFDVETHIPLIVSYGRNIQPRRVDSITESTDVAPTILKFAGAPSVPWFMGSALASRGSDGRWRFDASAAPRFATQFKQDGEPHRVALRFPAMTYMTRWRSGMVQPLPPAEANENLFQEEQTADGPRRVSLPPSDPRWAQARSAWAKMINILRKPPVARDFSSRRLLNRVQTLGYLQ